MQTTSYFADFQKCILFVTFVKDLEKYECTLFSNDAFQYLLENNFQECDSRDDCTEFYCLYYIFNYLHL